MKTILRWLLTGKSKGEVVAGYGFVIMVVIVGVIAVAILDHTNLDNPNNWSTSYLINVLVGRGGNVIYADSPGDITINGDFLPDANATRNIGSNSLQWLTGFFKNIKATTVNATQVNGTTGSFSQNLTASNVTVNGTLGAATGRGYTYIIASANATATEKAQADEIIATVNTDASPRVNLALSTYLDVKLTSGYFLANTTIILPTGSRLLGAGRVATDIQTNAPIDIISTGGNHSTEVGEMSIKNNGNLGAAIRATGSNSKMNYFHDFNLQGGNSIVSGVQGIVMDSSAWGLTVNNVFASYYDTAYNITGGGTGFVGVNLEFDQVNYGIFGGNVNGFTLKGGGGDHAYFRALWLLAPQGVDVSGGRYETNYGYTMYLDSYSGSVNNNSIFNGNTTSPGVYTVYIVGSTRKEFNGNIITSTVTSNSIYFDGTNNYASSLNTDKAVLVASPTTTTIRNANNYLQVNSSTVNLSANTSKVTIAHGLSLTPTFVTISSSSNETGWFSWTANATSINITSSQNVTVATPIYWRATFGTGN